MTRKNQGGFTRKNEKDNQIGILQDAQDKDPKGLKG